MKCPRLLLLILVVLMPAGMQSCGGGGGGSPAATAPTGAAQVSLTDAPGDYDNVFITVKSLSFHTSDAAGPRADGWHRYSLPAPVQIDLLGLANGNMKMIWDDIRLPVGTYRQIRIELAPTFDPVSLAGPANSEGTYIPYISPTSNRGSSSSVPLPSLRTACSGSPSTSTRGRILWNSARARTMF
jgi:hypothetical protein